MTLPPRLRALPFPALASWAVGMMMAHHPMLLSGLRRMQWDLGDTRFLVYALEHGYRWVMRYPHHLRFWDPPIFYPAPNVAAFSETLIGVGPIYWVWRLVGFPFDTAFQLWMLSVSTLNFAAIYLFLRRCLRFEGVPSALGAFLFAFAASRVNQLGHEQLLAHFYTVIAVYSLCRVVAPPEGQSIGKERLHLFVFFISLSLQLYAGVYYGWFLGLALSIAGLASFFFPRARARLLPALKRHWMLVPVAAGVAGAMLIPFYSHYVGAAAQVGFRDFGQVSAMLPRWVSWFDLGPYSWLYWRTAQTDLIRALPFEWEQRIGPGVLTLLVCLAGLFLERKRPVVQVMIVTFVTLVFLSLSFPSGWTAWKLIYSHVPAAGAIRTVCRIGLLALLPLSIGLAAVVARTSLRGPRLALATLVAICVLEQGITTPAFDKLVVRDQLAKVAAQIPSDCDAFLLSPEGNSLPTWKYHLDSMWLQLITGVPTLNGYSGNEPAGWGFSEPRFLGPHDEARIAEALRSWSAQHSWNPRKLCHARVHVDDGIDDGVFVAQRVPERMIAGQVYKVEITMKNTGTSAWTPPMNFMLALADPAEAGRWGVNRVPIPQYVDPGSQLTFLFDVRAPAAAGTYPFQWRVLHDWVGWASGPAPLVMVEVAN